MSREGGGRRSFSLIVGRGPACFVAMVLLLRLCGPCFSFKSRPVLASFVGRAALYLDSLFQVLTSPVDPIALFRKGVGKSLAFSLF